MIETEHKNLKQKLHGLQNINQGLAHQLREAKDENTQQLTDGKSRVNEVFFF